MKPALTSTLKSSRRLNLLKYCCSLGSTSMFFDLEYFRKAQNFSSPYSWPVRVHQGQLNKRFNNSLLQHLMIRLKTKSRFFGFQSRLYHASLYDSRNQCFLQTINFIINQRYFTLLIRDMNTPPVCQVHRQTCFVVFNGLLLKVFEYVGPELPLEPIAVEPEETLQTVPEEHQTSPSEPNPRSQHSLETHGEIQTCRVMLEQEPKCYFLY